MVQLLEEVCVTNKENLMISYSSDSLNDTKSTYDGCFPFVNNIISCLGKEQISVSLYSNEDEHTPSRSNGKHLLWMKQMLKKYNVGQDVMTLSLAIFSKVLDANQFEELWCFLGVCIREGL